MWAGPNRTRPRVPGLRRDLRDLCPATTSGTASGGVQRRCSLRLDAHGPPSDAEAEGDRCGREAGDHAIAYDASTERDCRCLKVLVRLVCLDATMARFGSRRLFWAVVMRSAPHRWDR